MSIFSKNDYINDTKLAVGKKDNRIVMKKTKQPTQNKTSYSICPRCSKKGYNQKKGFCKLCKFRFTPNKEIVWKKTSVK